MRKAVRTRRSIVMTLCVLHCGLCITACSVPNLESQACIEARGAVKRLYSFHFANDMRPSSDNLRKLQPFLTKELYKALGNSGDAHVDYFTNSTEPPKTFKIAKCVETDGTTAELQVQVYWRDDNRTDQKEVYVQAANESGTWLVNKVSN